MTNSRLKDYLDLQVPLERETVDQDILVYAIAATFTRRGITIPSSPPIGLTDEFVQDASRQTLWSAFLRKNQIETVPLEATIALLRTTLLPALIEARRKTDNRSKLRCVEQLQFGQLRSVRVQNQCA